MGSYSRKFLNLIVNEHIPGFKTLRCIDLTRQKLFNDDASAAAADGAGGARDAATSRPPPASETMRRVWLPRPSFTFRPGDSDANDEWGMHCFPLGDRKVICADQSGLAFVFDAETRVVGTMRGLGRPKRMPLSLPNFSAVDIRNLRGSSSSFLSLFVMRFPEPEAKRWAGKSGQFEGFFNNAVVGFSYWNQRLFPQPPFAVDEARSSTHPGPVEITAYTMVGRVRGSSVHVSGDGTHFFEGGSCVCVSAAGAGTYCLDMHRHDAWKWTQVGEWMLPFHGKAEYVPELKLWFGFSAESRHLAAADLSGMKSLSLNREPPQLVGTWEELDDPPKEWRECRDPQIVNLGSGRFCIARFFKTSTSASSSDDGDGKTTGEDFAVLTGVEVVPCVDDDSQAAGDSGSGKVMKLRMIRHKSRLLHGGGTIDRVF